MTALDPIDLRDAMMSVAVANTPIFLARRLHENPALQRAHLLHGSTKIFTALESISKREPEDLNQATEVYFYLVALSLDTDLSRLRRAQSLIVPHIKWFKEIADYLTSTAKATAITSLQAPSIIGLTPPPNIDPTAPRNSTANTSTLIRL